MALPSGWCELHQRRFREVPENCGCASAPGVLEEPAFRDWSERKTTPDQRRIEDYLDSFDLTDLRILHIGVGNSKLARRFHARVREIFGSTVAPGEVETGRLRGIGNYHVVLQNKYAARPGLTPGQFDFIIDNNPASVCCCMTHLIALFDFYSAKLGPGGQIVTDREGIAWTPPEANPVFQMNFNDLEAIAATAGFSASSIDRNIYVLTRGEPARRPHRIGTIRRRVRGGASMIAQRLHRSTTMIASFARAIRRPGDALGEAARPPAAAARDGPRAEQDT